MIKYIDQEEKELIESLYSEEWEPNPDKTVNKVYEDYARKSIEFDKILEIALSQRDFEKIKVKAIEEGIPYQALVSMLIHNYNEGKIVLTI